MSSIETQRKYTVKDGKLYKDGKPVKLEFGNRDQIAAIRNYEKRSEQFKTEGVILEPQFEATVKWQCLCGSFLDCSNDIVTSNNLRRFHLNQVDCIKCNRNYGFAHNEENELVVKLIEPRTN